MSFYWYLVLAFPLVNMLFLAPPAPPQVSPCWITLPRSITCDGKFDEILTDNIHHRVVMSQLIYDETCLFSQSQDAHAIFTCLLNYSFYSTDFFFVIFFFSFSKVIWIIIENKSLWSNKNVKFGFSWWSMNWDRLDASTFTISYRASANFCMINKWFANGRKNSLRVIVGYSR